MTEKKKKPTSFDVAKLANVHRSAVSRALSGKGRVSEETRERVMKAAQELGYRVNYLARGLHDQNSGLVGLVASRLDTPYRALQVIITNVFKRFCAFFKISFVANTQTFYDWCIKI